VSRALDATADEEIKMDRTEETVRIVGMSGSLRRASFSTSLLKVLAQKAAPDIDLQVVTLIRTPRFLRWPTSRNSLRRATGS
jgi:hypothetical protein